MLVGCSGLSSSVGTGASRRAAVGAVELPVAGRELGFARAAGGRPTPCAGHVVLALAVDRHRRGDHELAHAVADRRVVGQDVQQDRGAARVDVDVALDLVHRLADADHRRLVEDDVDPGQGRLQRVAVAHVAQHVLGFRVAVVGPAALLGQRAVHLRLQVVEDAHAMAPRQQGIDQMRTDESGAAGD